MHCKALVQKAHGYAMRNQRLFHKELELGTPAEHEHETTLDDVEVQEGDMMTLITDAKAGSSRATTQPQGAARGEEAQQELQRHSFSYSVYVFDSDKGRTIPVRANEATHGERGSG